jgi:hypothetical protein
MKNVMHPISLYLIIAVVTIGCGPSQDSGSTSDEAAGANPAQQIVDRAIELHGGDHFESSEVEFDFRGTHYTVRRDDGMFRYSRSYTDSTGRIVEVMTNDTFERTLDGEPYEMTEKEYMRYTEQVNANVYFTFLPYKLNDPAVVKRLLDPVTIEGEPYQTVEVTFEKEGGGRDWEDRFLFWFHRDDGTMDYFSYFYTLRGTARFRKLINERKIGGIIFADHLNFNADSLGRQLEIAPAAFEAGELPLASEVHLENIQVTPIE